VVQRWAAQLNHDERVAVLVDELAAVESRLDTQSHPSERRVADLVTVALLLPLAIGLDWHAERPLLLLGAMLGAIVLNRIPLLITRWRLSRAQERLFGEYTRILELTEGVSGASSPGRDSAPTLGENP
jgi:hypothetical protein